MVCCDNEGERNLKGSLRLGRVERTLMDAIALNTGVLNRREWRGNAGDFPFSKSGDPKLGEGRPTEKSREKKGKQKTSHLGIVVGEADQVREKEVIRVELPTYCREKCRVTEKWWQRRVKKKKKKSSKDLTRNLFSTSNVIKTTRSFKLGKEGKGKEARGIKG